MNITLCKTVRDQTVPIIAAPPSKSDAHRLMILAALSDRATLLHIPERSADILATERCLRAMGADFFYAGGCYRVTPVRPGRPTGC